MTPVLKKLGIAAASLGLASTATSCVQQQCEVVDLELRLTSFADDPPVRAGLAYCDPDQGPCVGASGAIAFLPEQVTVESPTQQDLHGSATGFWGERTYLAVGDAGTLVVARGSYGDWALEPIDTDADLWGVATRLQASVAVAVGDGVVVWSDDAGANWQVDALPGDVRIEHLERLSDDSLFGAGSDGRLWHTDDGRSWSEAESPTDQSITALYVVGEETLLADVDGRVFSRAGDGDWSVLDVPGSAPVVSFSGRLLVWALRADGSLAYRFADRGWKTGNYTAEDGNVLAAGEYEGYYVDAYDDGYLYYEYGWAQSVCVVDQDGEVHSASAWIDPVLECEI